MEEGAERQRVQYSSQISAILSEIYQGQEILPGMGLQVKRIIALGHWADQHKSGREGVPVRGHRQNDFSFGTKASAKAPGESREIVCRTNKLGF